MSLSLNVVYATDTISSTVSCKGVIEAGGRICLGKDSYTEATTFRTIYPDIDRWLAAQAQYDPYKTFTSNLGRRLHLS